MSMATSPSGKAGVCKTPIAGSNPAVASQFFSSPLAQMERSLVFTLLTVAFHATQALPIDIGSKHENGRIYLIALYFK